MKNLTRYCFGFALSVWLTSLSLSGAQETISSDGERRIQLLPPDIVGPTRHIVSDTLNEYFSSAFGWKIPLGDKISPLAVNLVIGNEKNNPILASLVADGLSLRTEELGDEGFQILSHETDGKRLLIVAANTPRGLKHGCQELMYFRINAASEHVAVDWPLDVVMTPQIAYRGIYMLPIWSAYDSLESWKRVLQFNSELTLNRVWFWLDGFPVAGHPASSHGPNLHFERTVLASDENVQSLIDLVNSEAMKFYIGGGWLSWHHWEVVGQDRKRARDYYFDYLRTFQGVSGFYFEPTGEGAERADWLPGDSLQKMIKDLWARDPQFEVAVAIGAFNNSDYLELMSQLDPKRAYWWWCWGDPHKDKAYERYPSVLGWHTTVQMSTYHGTTAPPSTKDMKLAGMATSYDPGMGYGNPWNGWAKMGVYKPRNFDPHTLPYFSHQYKFRERCWNVEQTDEQFEARLARRLFDADMPSEAIDHYLALARFCSNPLAAEPEAIADIAAFIREHGGHGTPRNQDTLVRMQEAVDGILHTSAKGPKK